MCSKAKTTSSTTLKRSFVQGPGAPAYSLAQLFSVLRVKLGKICLFYSFLFVKFSWFRFWNNRAKEPASSKRQGIEPGSRCSYSLGSGDRFGIKRSTLIWAIGAHTQQSKVQTRSGTYALEKGTVGRMEEKKHTLHAAVFLGPTCCLSWSMSRPESNML